MLGLIHLKRRGLWSIVDLTYVSAAIATTLVCNSATIILTVTTKESA